MTPFQIHAILKVGRVGLEVYTININSTGVRVYYINIIVIDTILTPVQELVNE